MNLIIKHISKPRKASRESRRESLFFIAVDYLRISLLGINLNLKWFYGVLILFLLVGSSNAVNLTDGLDGLAGGLSVIAFLAFGLIAWVAGGLKDIKI